MIKAIDFWNCLCNEFDYRFFAGVPCVELKSLYLTMSDKFMHYIPTVNENVALGLASGVELTGIKSGVILHISSLYDLFKHYTTFSMTYNIPVILLVGYTDDKDISLLTKLKIPYKKLTDSYNKDLKSIISKIEQKEFPAALLIKEGSLK